MKEEAMGAKIAFCTHSLKKQSSGQPPALKVEGNSVKFTCPQPLKDAGFPVNDVTYSFDVALDSPPAATMTQKLFSTSATNFIQKRQNLVTFCCGTRSTPKRGIMYGTESGGEGYATQLIADAVQCGAGKGIFVLSCYVIGTSDHLIDLLNLANELGTVVESVKDGPSVRMIERRRVSSAADVRTAMKTVVKNYEKVFAPVLCENQPTPELEALPPYMPDSIVLQLYRYEDETSFSNYMEANSMSFVALGDSERPVLCGIDASTQQQYEKAQRALSSAVGIVSSILCCRLRIPFGKSKISQLLRRAYNAERGYPYNTANGSTSTVFIAHAFSDATWAEESFHSLSLTRRMSNVIGSVGMGSVTRDLAVDKWRLDQDVLELRDELMIARTVYDYKPCLYEQAKPVANFKEEEQLRINAIHARREEAREKQLKVVRERAEENAQQAIKSLEAKAGITLAELEKKLEAKKKENSLLQEDREKRVKEYEQTLQKIRKKKEDEESACEKLREEMQQLEEELKLRQSAIDAKKKQLEIIQLDRAKGRDEILKERESIRAMRKTVLDERKSQRKQWIDQIKEINNKVLEEVRMLAGERNKNGEVTTEKEKLTEKALLDDIKTIENYLPKLISLEDIPVNAEETEAIRRQFDEVFTAEKKRYMAKIEEERVRKEKLERGLEAYRQRLLEEYQTKKQAKLHDAVTKEQHLNSLVDQVINYLRNGTRMIKISSKGNIRRRFYFLSDDCKRIHSCEFDNQGNPLNRKKPTVTIWMKEIKKVVIGLYTSSFVNFSGEEQLAKARQEAISDLAAQHHDLTQNLNPSNLGLNNYRSFALLLRGGKSVEVVCETDSDCEAWLVALKRLLHVKTPVERILEERLAASKDIHLPAPEVNVEMKWGGPLDIRSMRGFVSLVPEEATMCSENHVPPALYLRVRQEMSTRSQSNAATVYDVRITSGLDLFRSSQIYDYLCERRIIPLPY